MLCITASQASFCMRVFFQVATAPALIRMHMADERTLIPSNLTAHIAPCFIGAKIGILVVIGILSPNNYGVVRLALIRLPYCRIGLVFRNRDITGGSRHAPAEEGIALLVGSAILSILNTVPYFA